MARGEKWKEREARIHIDTLGWVHCHRGQYKDMRKVAKDGLNIIESMDRPNRDLQAIASCYLSRADRHQRSINTARQNLMKVQKYEKGMHPLVIARLRSYTGELQSAGEEWSAARASFEEALLIRQAIGEQIGMATNRLQLANMELRLRHYEEARALFSQSMSDGKIRGVNLARARFGLAQIDWVEEKYGQALELVDKAVTEFGCLGMGSDLKQAMKLVYKAVTEFERLGMKPELKRATEIVDKAVTEFERLGMKPELKRAMQIRKQWLEQEKV
jgi:tetratricopeptide (TPR) repeat protein